MPFPPRRAHDPPAGAARARCGRDLLAWSAAGLAAYGLFALGGDGRPGALATGARAGGWCLMTSWGLMAALFALGVMSLTWMALVAGVVALQKIGPWPRLARALTTATLIALAVAILAAPRDIPGLVVPGLRGAIQTTGGMR